MPAPKPMLLSKTAWANALPLLITVIGGLANTDFILANPILSAVVIPSAIYILNLILRYVTSAPISGIMSVLLALGLGGILSPTEVADAGLFRRTDGAWRTPIRTSVAAFSGARGRLNHRSHASACSSCSPQAAAQGDCAECVTAEKAAAAVAAVRTRLNLGQHAVFKRFEQNHVLRERFAQKWNAKYAMQIDPNNLQQFLEIILKYLPQVIEILLMLFH